MKLSKYWRGEKKVQGGWIERHGFKYVHHIEDPHVAVEILKNESDYPLGTSLKQFMAILFGKNILAQDGEDWHAARKAMSPAMLSKAMDERFIPIINEQLTRIVSEDRSKKDGTPVSLGELSRRFAIAVMGSAMVGKDATDEEKALPYHVLEQSMTGKRAGKMQIGNMLLDRFGVPGLLPMYGQKSESKLPEKARRFYDMAAQRIGGKEKSGGLLDELAKIVPPKDKALDASQVYNQAAALMGAGFFTTSVSISLTIDEIMKDKDLTARVKDEARSYTGEGFPADYKDKFPTITNCLKETLRLYPPVYQLRRRAKVSHEFNGVVIPAGREISIDVGAIHRNPDFFSEPNRFNPDRFNGRIPAGVWMPFGYGPRVCVGQKIGMMEAVAMIQKLFQDYDIQLTETLTGIRKSDSSIFLAPEGDIKALLTPVR